MVIKWLGKMDCIMVYENAIKSSMCSDMVNFLKTSDHIWEPYQTKFGKHSIAYPKKYKIPLIEQACYDAFDIGLKEYSKKFLFADRVEDEGYHILRFRPGDSYGLHKDGSSKYARVVSGLIYLNEDYKGGELHFPKEDLKIKPKIGSVVIFPSNFLFLHKVMPVTEGERYSVVAFFRGYDE